MTRRTTGGLVIGDGCDGQCGELCQKLGKKFGSGTV
jgi:hypothetical protein